MCKTVLPLARSIAAFGVLALLAGPAPAQAQSQPGRLLISPRHDIVLECNLDASNCFHLVGASQSAGDPGGGDQQPSGAYAPSIARNGIIAFQAIYGTDGTCAPGAQGICKPHIFLMNADGTNVRQITFNPADASQFGGDTNAAISPDGTMVAFISNRNAFPDANNNQVYLYEIYIVNADGSNLREVTFPVYGQAGSPQAGNPYGDVQSLAWSPDSRQLAFKGHAYGAYCGTYGGFYNSCGVVGTINADGTGLNYLAGFNYDENSSAFAIDWSPDGTLIAYAHDSVHWGEPTIAIIDRSGQGRYQSVCGQDQAGTPAWWGIKCGLSLPQLGVQAGYSGELCPNDGHCLHFSPDSTQLAYENNSPSDNPSFLGISTIHLDGTGRSDAAAFGTTLENGIWWAAGPALPAAVQIALAPNTVEVWPGFSQQLTPTLLDANNNLISHTARAYYISSVYWPRCSVQIGPYGLVMYSSTQYGLSDPALSAANESVSSNNVSLKCWPSAPCTYTLGATSGNFPAAGGPGNVTVNADPGSNASTCPWNAVSNASWITIASGSSGSGNGSVSFSVAANTGAARQGTMTIAGLTFTVNQDAVSAVTLQSIAVSPNPASVPAGLTQQFNATGSYSDGSSRDLTTSVTWSSSNTSVATISNSAGAQGLATGVSTGGPVTINAALTGVSGTASLTVTAPVLQSITVSPATVSVAAGLTQQFTATGHYSNNSTQPITGSVTWSSSNTGIATISSQGLATGVAAGGPITITAAQASISGTAQLTVTAPVLVAIAVTPANPSVPVGSTQQFTATGSYSNGSTQNITGSVTWASSNPAVAAVSGSGLASALAAGPTMISAQQGSVSNSTAMTVITLQSITIGPVSPSILVGATLQFTATGHYSDGSTRDLTSTAVWTSSKTSVATISSPGGLATGIAKGSTTIKAAAGALSGSTTLTVSAVILESITVTPASATIQAGGSQQFKATGNYNNGATQDLTNSVAWSSSSKAVASVSKTGLATGQKAGTSTITAKSGAVTGSATLTVQ